MDTASKLYAVLLIVAAVAGAGLWVITAAGRRRKNQTQPVAQPWQGAPQQAGLVVPQPDTVINPAEIKASPFFWPNIIAALIASIGIIIGSIGPWATFMAISKNAVGGDGTITLILGIVAAVEIFALLNFARTNARSKFMTGLGTAAVICGLAVFFITVVDAREVTSRRTEVFDTTIGLDIGWGLWMAMISSAALAATALIVVLQIRKIAATKAK